MAALSAIAIGLGALTLYSAYEQSESMKAQGEYQKQQGDMNARLSGMQAEDAIKRGDLAAAAHRRKSRSLVGYQRAAAAASGVDVNYGSARDTQMDTMEMSAFDEMTIKNNAWRESWGYKTQALQYTQQGQMAASGAERNARNTLLVGGIQAAGYGRDAYRDYKTMNAPSKKGT